MVTSGTIVVNLKEAILAQKGCDGGGNAEGGARKKGKTVASGRQQQLMQISRAY